VIRIALAVAAVASLVLVADAGGQSSIEVDLVTGAPGAGATAVDQAPVHISGGITVSWSGACGATCRSSGTIVWTAPPGGALAIVGSAKRGSAVLFADSAQAPALAQATRADAHGVVGTCGDAGPDSFGEADFPVRRGRVTIGFGRARLDVPDPLETRCGGPLFADIAPVLPWQPVPLARLRRGATVDLTGTRQFAAHGLSGEVASTLVIRVGRPHRQPSYPAAAPALRGLLATYRIERVSGALRVRFSGLPDPARCAPLDACGAAGTIVVSPRASAGEATLLTVARRTRPLRDLRAALGVASGRLRVTWAPDSPDADPLRTRCAGPVAADFAGPFLSGSAPLSALRRSRLEIVLTRGSRSTGDGYDAVTSGRLTLVLRRLRVGPLSRGDAGFIGISTISQASLRALVAG